MAELSISVTDSSLISKYEFGTKTADFYVCAICGVAPFVLSNIDGTTYAVVNVNTLVNFGTTSFAISSTDFDGEDTGSRLERRKRNWIPGVTLDESIF